MPKIPVSVSSTAAALPAGSCVVAMVTVAQSNPIGTNSYYDEAPSRAWDLDIPGVFVWDQVKRVTTTTHTFKDTDAGHLNEYSQFRPMTVGYGRSSNGYPWDESPVGEAGFKGIGLAMQLSFRLRQHYRVPVYIIVCGKGSTGVTNLITPGAYDWNIIGLDTKVESLLELARDYYWGAGLYALLNDLGYARSDIHMAGVVSMIGATDSNGSTNYLTFEGNLTDCIAEVRSWINPSTPTDVPWVQVRSEPYFDIAGDVTNGHTRIAEIRQIQEDIAASGVNIRLASCDECIREDDGEGEHILGQGQIVLGNSVAAQLIQFSPMASPEGEVEPT